MNKKNEVLKDLFEKVGVIELNEVPIFSDEAEGYDRERLQAIVDYNNKLIEQDERAVIKVDHVFDEANPTIGYITGYSLGQRKGRWTIFSDWKILGNHRDKLLGYPNRSAEINKQSGEIFGVALLGNKPPALKLGSISTFAFDLSGDCITCYAANEEAKGEDMTKSELRALFEEVLAENPAIRFATKLMVESERNEKPDEKVELAEKPEDETDETEETPSEKTTLEVEDDEKAQEEPSAVAEGDEPEHSDDNENGAQEPSQEPDSGETDEKGPQDPPSDAKEGENDNGESPEAGQEGNQEQGSSDSGDDSKETPDDETDEDDDEEEKKKKEREKERTTYSLAEQYQREAIDFKIKYEDITAKYSKAEAEASKYKKLYTRETREKDLILLQREGVRFVLDRELNDLVNLPEEKYQKQLERIRTCYTRAPVGAGKKIDVAKDSYKLSDDEIKTIEKLAVKNKLQYSEAKDRYLQGKL